MTIKLIAIDLDGTLLTSEKTVSDENKKALQAAHEAGIKIVLCTGRPTPGVTDYLEELGLETDDDYAITYNGAMVQNVGTQEIMVDYRMNHADYLLLEKEAAKAGTHFHAIHDTALFTPNKNISPYTVRESFLSKVPLFYRTPEEMGEPSYNKMMMIDFEPILEKAISRLPKELWDKYTILRSEPFFLEFLNKNASKGKAVKALAEHLSIPQKSIMAIGDNENDLDMITFAGIGVAMGNAVDKVKDEADVITRTNDENGVAHVIYTHALAK